MREKIARQICGRDLDIVKEGLDASQVEDLVTELVSERDSLLQRQEHLSSLTRLAERSVAEADALSQEIKREAEDEAKKQSSAILAKAEQEALELGERKKGEIISAATKEAQSIKDAAQKEVDRLISRQQAEVQKEMEKIVQGLHSQLLTGLNSVTEQANALQQEWRSKISEAFTHDPVTASQPEPPATPEPAEKTSPAVAETEPAAAKAEPAEAKTEPIAEATPPETVEPVQNTQPSSIENLLPEIEEPAPEPETKAEAPAPATDDADLSYRQDILAQIEQAWLNSEKQAADKTAGKAETTDTGTAEKTEVSTLAPEASQSPAYEGTLALDILPPLNPSQLVEIQKYLRAWPGIGITELSPHNDGYSITVVLQKPMQLLDILKQLPEVSDAREYVPEGGDTDSLDKGDKKRIAITVCNNK